MLLLLLACWSPDPGAASVQLPALDPVLTGGGADEAAPADTDGDAAPDGADEPEAPPAPAFTPYEATTTAAPVTLVDDFGQPVAVLQQPGVAVRVIGEEPIRKRVSCAVCVPAAEGWVQPSVVTDRP